MRSLLISSMSVNYTSLRWLTKRCHFYVNIVNFIGVEWFLIRMSSFPKFGKYWAEILLRNLAQFRGGLDFWVDQGRFLHSWHSTGQEPFWTTPLQFAPWGKYFLHGNLFQHSSALIPFLFARVCRESHFNSIGILFYFSPHPI